MTKARRSHARHATPWRARLARDDGATAIEFLITASTVLFLFFASVQAANYYYARSVAAAAAHEGADAQRAYNAAPGAGAAKANAFLASAGDSLTGTHVSVSADAQQVQVTVTGHCLSIIPGFCAQFPIRVTVHGTVERPTNP